MPQPNPEALRFLLSRRSCPARTLTLPVPDRAALEPILTAAARSPDHGKLEPWRFIVLTRPALERLAGQVALRATELALPSDQAEKGVLQFSNSNLAVAVVHVPRSTEKIAQIEQVLSIGAVCLALLNAALAAGWGANWLTGWPAHDAAFAHQGLGLAPGEWVAGFIHIGTATVEPTDRPRPDLSAITTWVDA
ncbi:nitroreductase [Rhodobacter veldkampii DSM 11550]|uniref:Putative NAD(P)H nitroreductase n=1 Tax=Phaeovulum veldkampii DSM 11550 TaxID=1185920 RepID=A0A2T4JGC8_9RHOB|nr:nitroreductase family protein [Phaeovulum veldkampii]MBK5947771.1 nitroreductase [Phaeovulum veldkampii DSM 11550]PTE16962.1 nitroreductase [Phaeovulum veldkampii DSM 11550]TDQ55991.1 nitroreductase [Phaeovulum veldkampii DSM 11550]